MIRIRSQKAGFLRCGIAHPADWTEYPDGTFTAEQIRRFLSEPMLQVETDLMEVRTTELVSIKQAALDALYEQLEEHHGKYEERLRQIQQLSDRVIQVERERDEARGEADSLATEKSALEAEVERLKPFEIPLEGVADPPKPKSKKGAEA